MTNWLTFSQLRSQQDVGDYWISTQEGAKAAGELIKPETLFRGAVVMAAGATVVVALAGVTVSYLYISVPDGLYPVDKWKIRQIHARNKLAALLARIWAHCGLGKEMDFHRYLRDGASIQQTKNPNIYMEHLKFGEVDVVMYRKHIWNIAPNSSDSPDRRPALVHIYGGGWTFGTSHTYEQHHRLLTEKLDAVVLTLNYRKAPENPFPIPFDECFTVVKYFHEHAEEFNVDPSRIGILGDSAGGNLAAAVVIKLSDEGLTRVIKNQLLIYPAVQCMNFQTESYMANFPLQSRQGRAAFTAFYADERTGKLAAALLQNLHVSQELLDSTGWQYLKKYVKHHPIVAGSIATDYESFQKKALNPYMSPLMAETMRGLPPTLLMICQFDVLKDDALAYMDRLQADGVPVGLKVYAGIHGTFRYFEDLKVGQEMMHDVIEYFRANL